MQKQTILDQIEIKRDGHIQLRFIKQVVDDDGTVLSEQYHRTVIPPGGDIDAQMAVVNDHLEQMKMARVEASELTALKAVAPIVQTAEKIAAYEAIKAGPRQSDR